MNGNLWLLDSKVGLVKLKSKYFHESIKWVYVDCVCHEYPDVPTLRLVVLLAFQKELLAIGGNNPVDSCGKTVDQVLPVRGAFWLGETLAVYLYIGKSNLWIPTGNISTLMSLSVNDDTSTGINDFVTTYPTVWKGECEKIVKYRYSHIGMTLYQTLVVVSYKIGEIFRFDNFKSFQWNSLTHTIVTSGEMFRDFWDGRLDAAAFHRTHVVPNRAVVLVGQNMSPQWPEQIRKFGPNLTKLLFDTNLSA